MTELPHRDSNIPLAHKISKATLHDSYYILTSAKPMGNSTVIQMHSQGSNKITTLNHY